MAHRILLVDDHAIVRSGIRNLLNASPEFVICGEAANGKEAIEQVLVLFPDVVLMDISMPIMNGIEATRQIRRLSPATKVVIVSMHDSEQIAERAKEAGAQGYFMKSGNFQELRQTILKLFENLT